jgi:Fe-S oxidoreductase
MWKEEEPVRRQASDARGRVERPGKVNHARTQQLLRVLPSGLGATSTAGDQNPDRKGGAGPCKIATACPFCMTMLTDGLRDQEHTEIEQLDVAELLLRSVTAGPVQMG